MNHFVDVHVFLIHVVSAHARVIPGLVCVRRSAVYSGIQAEHHKCFQLRSVDGLTIKVSILSYLAFICPGLPVIFQGLNL